MSNLWRGVIIDSLLWGDGEWQSVSSRGVTGMEVSPGDPELSEMVPGKYGMKILWKLYSTVNI